MERIDICRKNVLDYLDKCPLSGWKQDLISKRPWLMGSLIDHLTNWLYVENLKDGRKYPTSVAISEFLSEPYIELNRAWWNKHI